jgi:RNA polymerase sigma-70 factor (ECF subfamily)
LLALLLFQHARRDARQRNGELVTLALQERSMWHHDDIDVACRLLDSTPVSTGFAEELRLQAAAAREHAIAADVAQTNWAAIAGFYADLEQHTGSPIVRLNRAIAVAEVDGPSAGLALLQGLDGQLVGSHRLHATRADLARRCGDDATARAEYAQAIELCGNEAERTFLRRQLETIGA